MIRWRGSISGWADRIGTLHSTCTLQLVDPLKTFAEEVLLARRFDEDSVAVNLW
jgi:hypothetical protein